MTRIHTTANIEIKNLENQLQCPEGKEGVSLGKLMNVTNDGMIRASVQALKLEPQNRVMEIGHGNCDHLRDILNQNKGLRYFGLEISQTMVNEANRNNETFVSERKALFQLYDGCKIPYVHNFFDRIMTVNTIYFWKDPKEFLVELHRVLKPKGTCVITFADADFMKNLPFVNDDFQLYDIGRMKNLVRQTDFELTYFEKINEQIESKGGALVDRSFIMVMLKKTAKIKEETTQVYNGSKW